MAILPYRPRVASPSLEIGKQLLGHNTRGDMHTVRAFAGSTVGRKAVMAVTGLVLVGYVIVHALGNLLVFRGRDAINDYAAFLKSNLGLLWGIRVVLLVSVILHVWAAVSLTRQ